jgi:antitoxin PrlF
MPYTARATTSGTAPALAFSKAFAAEHPEFTEGRFEAHVIAPGRLLISAPVEVADENEDEDDPVLGAFLGFLERSMREHPELVRPITARDIEGLDEMLEGIEVDLDEDLRGVDYVLP